MYTLRLRHTIQCCCRNVIIIEHTACVVFGKFGCLKKGRILYALVKAGVNPKAVFWLGIMFLMQISRLRFKQSRISMLISHIYVLGCFVNFLVIFRYI